ncbi:MAG: PDZ domain-containing protein [Lysobacterales bacterium]|jgi:predicted metalloprotease with PDZ domain
MRKLITTLLMALIVSVPAMAGDDPCKGSPEDCIAKMKAKYAEKAWLGIEYDKAEEGRWAVKKVYADSPADEAGFEKGDVILSMEGVDYTKANKKAIKEVYAILKPGTEVDYVVKRQGAMVELDATLAHVPEKLQKKWIAEHMKKYHPDYQLAATN